MPNPISFILMPLSKAHTFITGKPMWMQIVASIGLGLCASFAIRSGLPAETALQGDYLAELTAVFSLLGFMLIAPLKFLTLPLIVVSIFSAIAGNKDASALSKVGKRLIPLFLVTTLFSVTIGAAITYVMQPGSNSNFAPASPEIIAEMTATDPCDTGEKAISECTVDHQVKAWLPESVVHLVNSEDLLHIVLFIAVIALCFVGYAKTEGISSSELLVTKQMEEWQNALVFGINALMKHFVAYGVFGLITSSFAKMGGEAFIQVGGYMASVLLALLCLLLIYPLIIWSQNRHLNIFFIYVRFYANLKELMLMAFSTSSSSAVMPLSIKTSMEKNGVSKETAGMVVPLGTTINMDGTGAYQAVAAIFLLQLAGVPLTLSIVGGLMFTSIMSSIGTPGVPGAGMGILANIVMPFGVTAEMMALVYAVDRILDMTRTAVNVASDQAAALFVSGSLGEKPNLKGGNALASEEFQAEIKA